jgi:hypothetical protein
MFMDLGRLYSFPSVAAAGRAWRESRAILFLTHRADQRVIGHFERLRHETAHLLPAYLCADGAHVPEGHPARPDFRFELSDAWLIVPARFEAVRHDLRKFGGGELHFLPLMLMTPKLETYDHFWMIEYDADCAGHWGDVLAPCMALDADLIGAHMFARPDEPDWMHWPDFVCPADIPPERQIKGLFTIARFSRRLLELYVGKMQGHDWQGNYEAIFPTMAVQAGMKIADLSTRSPFGSESLGMLYRPEDFHCLEPRQAYFHEAPESFPERGLLYHPVKVEA